MFNNMSIRAKLLISFITVAIIAGAIGVIGYNRINLIGIGV